MDLFIFTLQSYIDFNKQSIANCTNILHFSKNILQIVQKPYKLYKRRMRDKKMPIKSAFFISYVWYDNIHYRKENQMQEPQIPSFHQDDQLHIARNMLIADH